MAETSTHRKRGGIAVLIPLALLASSAVVYQASNAAFTASTTNPANSWSSGTVALTDDDAGAALFNATGLKPGDLDSKCIVVTYSGTLNAAVKLYATNYTDTGLAQYMNFTVDEGTGAARDCSDFTSTANLYTGTLAGFSTTKTGYASGVSSWAPATTTTKTFRFSWTLQSNDAAQGKSSAATFTWEAQNT